MVTVAVLCADQKSIYKSMVGVEAYDANRDARTFSGGMPVVAHPPCRSWSVFTRHQAKPEPGEAQLGLWCAEMLKQCGGILEQPAHSLLFHAAGLPKPGEPIIGDLWSLLVWQAWWGYPVRKATWLCFSRIDPNSVNTPFRLHAKGADRRREQLMSCNQRSRTVPAFAEWLVNTARLVDSREPRKA